MLKNFNNVIFSINFYNIYISYNLDFLKFQPLCFNPDNLICQNPDFRIRFVSQNLYWSMWDIMGSFGRSRDANSKFGAEIHKQGVFWSNLEVIGVSIRHGRDIGLSHLSAPIHAAFCWAQIPCPPSCRHVLLVCLLDAFALANKGSCWRFVSGRDQLIVLFLYFSHML